MTMDTFRGCGNGEVLDDTVDEVVEGLVSYAPVMFMKPGEEFTMERGALSEAVRDAEEHGLPARCNARLLILGLV